MGDAARPEGPRSAVAELEAMAEIGRVLTSTLDLPEVLRRMMEKVSELLTPQRWSMLLLDESASRLRFEIVVGEGAERLQGSTLGVGEGVAGWVAERAETLLVPDVEHDGRWSDRFDRTSGFDTRSILAVPMAIRGRVLGVIELVSGADERTFDTADARLLEILGDFAAIAIDNARSYDRARALTLRDEHTGLYNARFLFGNLEQELERALRYHHPVSLIFLDLDRFKLVNDRHGHLAGSAVLKEVGEVLREACRKTDVPCRYGGDEFVVVLPETARDGALEVGERLRSAMDERRFLRHQGLELRLTASFGVASFPDDARTVKDLLDRADAAMYLAKDAGRNVVVSASAAREEPADAAAS